MDPSSEHGFNDQREFDVVRVIGAAFIRGGEIWRLDFVKVEDLFGDRLVLRKIESMGTAPV